MSFDLYFCSDKKNKLTKNDLSEYFANFPYFEEEWVYHNPNTGVYSVFEHLDDPNDENETLVPQRVLQFKFHY